MFGLFGQKAFLDSEDEAWHFDMWRWLLKHGRGVERLKLSPLVTPSRKFFPPTDATGHARAGHIFACVKRLAGMDQWPCELFAQPERPETRVGELAVLRSDKGALPLGTFRVEGNKAVISYDPKSVNDPAELVSTLVHELAHYWIAAAPEPPPGGEEMHEFATDLTTIFFGFGLFGANRAFNFSQHQDTMTQGWRYSRQGYLREMDWVFSLAIFLYLREVAADTLKGLLKPYLFSDLGKAERNLKRLAPSLT